MRFLKIITLRQKFNDINNEDTIEKSTEIQKIIYDIFEVNIKDYNELFINTLSDEIIVILPLLYLNLNIL